VPVRVYRGAARTKNTLVALISTESLSNGENPLGALPGPAHLVRPVAEEANPEVFTVAREGRMRCSTASLILSSFLTRMEGIRLEGKDRNWGFWPKHRKG
jgi:hypothetical protein